MPPSRPVVIAVGMIASLLLMGMAGAIPVLAQSPEGTVLVSDTLDGSHSSGWGAADLGGSYRHSGNGSYSTSGGYGSVVLGNGGSERTASLPETVVRDGHATVDVSVQSVPVSGSGIYHSLRLRDQDGQSYRATLRMIPGGDLALSMARIEGSGDALVPMGSEVHLPWTAGHHDWFTLSFATVGGSPVQLMARAWPRGGEEPDWQTTATDSSSSRLDEAGALALTTYASSEGSGTTAFYDTLRLTSASPTDPGPNPTPPPAPDPEPPTTTSSIGSTGSLPVGQARYAVPGSALFVAPGGSDSNDGSASRPFRTVSAAMNATPTGGTIVLREGTYNQRFTITKRLTIQNYPGEAVWFDGSSAVFDFAADGSTWRRDNWTTSFDSSTSFTFGDRSGGFVNGNYPMAAHPDQVWIDGVAQRQVGTRSQVMPGTFFVDYGSDQLFLGSNPGGKAVQASTLGRAIEIRADGAVLRGVGIRRYAPSIPDLGTVTVERPGVRVDNLVITDNSTIGISFLARDISAHRLTVLRNGLLGVHGNQTDNLDLSHILASGNNAEHFNKAPVSGGIKVTRTRGVSLTNGSMEDNDGPGFWLDESVYNGKLVNSVMRDNAGHGVSLEISALMIVANNLVKDNGGFGFKVNDTSEVSIWNNTVVGNNRPINIVQDNRRGDDPSVPGHDPRRPIPDPTMPWVTGPVTVRNNVISADSGNCLICVEDYSKEFSAEQLRVSLNNNVYQRDTTSSPQYTAIWSNGPGNPSVYGTLSAFTAATGQEWSSLDLVGVEAVGSDGQITARVREAAPTLAAALPAVVATLLGIPSPTRQLGADWNG